MFDNEVNRFSFLGLASVITNFIFCNIFLISVQNYEKMVNYTPSKDIKISIRTIHKIELANW